MIVRNAIEYAEKHVYFSANGSPINGKFDLKRYPFIGKPLLSLDDIWIKNTVVYGPTQSFKTVFLNIATAYRLGVYQCPVLVFAQSDPDAEEFAKVKLNPFLEKIPHLIETSKGKKHTILMWQWANHECIISGPSLNAQQSKSARFVHTDESHLFASGALAAINSRLGERWNKHRLDCTTAADEGKEVDEAFKAGNMQEWHNCCIHCGELFQPLWEEESQRTYNGHRVFQWIDSESEREKLDSIHVVCPHCDKAIENTARNRMLLDEGADYVAMNPGADRSAVSFRWNAFATRFKPWRDLFGMYLKAMESAKLGDYKPYEDFVKKQEVRTWSGEFPSIGTSCFGRDHASSEIVVADSDLVLGSFDVQSEGGFHIWALADVWHANGDSKRLAYDKLYSFDELRAWQLKHGIRDFNPRQRGTHPTMIGDCGHKQQEVWEACARWNWLAAKSDDNKDGHTHIVKRKGMRDFSVDKPWSVPTGADSMIGKKLEKGVPRFCPFSMWSIPRMYPLFYALKNGETKSKYSIATDFSPEFVEQLHSYSRSISTDKKTGSKEFVNFKKIRKQDHAFVCGTQSLMLAMIHGRM